MNRSTLFVVLSVLLLQAGSALADARSKAATEVAEWVARKFGKEAVKEGVEAFSKRLASSAARHGDEVFAAVRRIGPRGLLAVEEAGEHGGKVARLIVNHGDDAVVWVAKRPTGMALLARHGEEAGAALCKHQAIAEQVIEKLGEPAAHALAKVGPQSGRRLAIMAESGELARIGRSEQLLGVVGKYGDKAATFVWEHKGALAVGTVLTAFLADPEPFIDGTVRLAEPIAEVPGKIVDGVVAPIAQAPANAVVAVSDQVAKKTNWTVILSLLGVGLLGIFALRSFARPKREHSSATSQSPAAAKEVSHGVPKPST